MGSTTTEARIYATVSSNNDERDEQDKAAWVRFLAELRTLVRKPEYADLEIRVDDYGSY